MLLSIRCEVRERDGATVEEVAKAVRHTMQYLTTPPIDIERVIRHPGSLVHPKPIFEAVTQMGGVIWYQKQSDKQIGRVFWCQPELGVAHDRWSLCDATLSMDASSDSELEAFAYARRS